jgi:hypothetical protein
MILKIYKPLAHTIGYPLQLSEKNLNVFWLSCVESDLSRCSARANKTNKTYAMYQSKA